jgi:hypothetical protein
MKLIAILAVLLCSACASNDQMAKGENYKPPEYRTGSHLPNQGGSRSPDSATVDGTTARASIPPTIVPRGN